MARGGLLDYDAVKSALEAGQIGGLGLDVQWQEPVDPEDFFAMHPKCDSIRYASSNSEVWILNVSEPQAIRSGSPRWSADDLMPHPPSAELTLCGMLCRVVLTPHIAGVTELSYRAMARDTAEAVRRSRQGLPPIRCINQLTREQQP